MLVASSSSIRVRCRRSVDHNSLLLGLSEFLFGLLGINELIPSFAARIEPLQECFWLSSSLLRQRDHGVSSWLLALRWNGLQRCIQDGPVRIEDLHKVSVRRTVDQLKKVGTGRQYLTRNLNGLAESHCGGFVILVSMSGELEEEGKSNDQAYGNVTFVDFHMIHLLKKYWYLYFTSLFTLLIKARQVPKLGRM